MMFLRFSSGRVGGAKKRNNRLSENRAPPAGREGACKKSESVKNEKEESNSNGIAGSEVGFLFFSAFLAIFSAIFPVLF